LARLAPPLCPSTLTLAAPHTAATAVVTLTLNRARLPAPPPGAPAPASHSRRRHRPLYCSSRPCSSSRLLIHGLDGAPVLHLEAHCAGRARYVLSYDAGRRIYVFTENGRRPPPART
uniref:Uncharacterized protein n=1 Tax=Aegilops tauschii subsp. strangulata TaxID=200361 RepID=A0A452XCE5_AEGTS